MLRGDSVTAPLALFARRLGKGRAGQGPAPLRRVRFLTQGLSLPVFWLFGGATRPLREIFSSGEARQLCHDGAIPQNDMDPSEPPQHTAKDPAVADASAKTKGRRRRKALVWAAPVLAAALVALGMNVFPQPAPTPAPPMAEPTRVADLPTYPISGFFISASPSAKTNNQKLQDIKAVGGDTAITFGSLLRPAEEDSLPEDCLIGGVNCAKAVAGKSEVARYFTYSDGSHWGEAALKCPRDRTVEGRGRTYTVLLLPAKGTGCTSPEGMYDVVVVTGGPTAADDPTHSLVAAATRLGMKFFAGLPAPIKRTDLDYLPDLSYVDTLSLFTDRFLQYQAAENDMQGLVGFYHHTEMPVSDNPVFEPILSLYTMQNRAIQRVLPARSAIVSPYIESRLGAANINLGNARDGMRKIAGTGKGLTLNIAIQDGMGTGKGAAYSWSEAKSSVDPFAASIVGKGVWAEKYVAPNKDYFRAAAEGVAGTGAVLWANLEGMAPATTANPCGESLRGQTTLARMDRQLQQMDVARKVISFMWDSYFTCSGTGTALKTQLESGFTTPIITDSVIDERSGLLQIRGFNLTGGTVTVTWTSGDGRTAEKMAEPTSTNTSYGEQNGLNPRLEMIAVDIFPKALDSGDRYSVVVKNGWGMQNETPYSERA